MNKLKCILNSTNSNLEIKSDQCIDLTCVNIQNSQKQFKNYRSHISKSQLKEAYFIDQFAFVKNFNNILNNQTGVIISYKGIEP